ncbi:MAG: PilN domain-containing protein [Acidobacteriota bacterium]
MIEKRFVGDQGHRLGTNMDLILGVQDIAIPEGDVFAMEPLDGGIEIYGESAAKPLLSAAFDVASEDALLRVTALSASELRIENTPVPAALSEILHAEHARAYAAALSAACPLSSSSLNLLPAELRQVRSAWQWVPTVGLGAAVVLAAIGLLLFDGYYNGSYLQSLNQEIAKVQPRAQRAAALDQEIQATRARTALLDNLRKHGKADMDVLAGMTSLLAPPIWLRSLDMNPKEVSVTGEADQAAPLLKEIDGSPLFEGSEFTSPPSRIQNVENFSIRTLRTGAPR